MNMEGVYLVTDQASCRHYPIETIVSKAVQAGISCVQLREKNLDTRAFLARARALKTILKDARIPLIINDRVDIAIAVDADGVHLGQTSIPPYAVRRLAASLIVGVSTHNIKEAIRAEVDGADFITYGPIWPTPSKAKYGKPLGIEAIAEVVDKVSIPVFGIGGVSMDNIKELVDNGAAGGSMISSIFGAKDIKASALKTLKVLK